MWLVYSIAVILGGGSLFIQVVSGHHDVGGHQVEMDNHDASHGPGILSLRSLTFGVAAFGLVGAPLDTLGVLGPLPALAVAIASGVAASFISGWAFRNVWRSSVSGAAAFDELHGQTARVLVSCGPTERGKVRVSLKGQLVDLMATTRGGEIEQGAAVTVVEVLGDEVRIERDKPRRHSIDDDILGDES
jgi:membrane protein implicated in regulation of membrane protease activity